MSMSSPIHLVLKILNGFEPRCGLHDLFGHHGAGTPAPDVHTEAFVVAVLIILFSSAFILIF